jgi:hypothetical protein
MNYSNYKQLIKRNNCPGFQPWVIDRQHYWDLATFLIYNTDKHSFITAKIGDKSRSEYSHGLYDELWKLLWW